MRDLWDGEVSASGGALMARTVTAGDLRKLEWALRRADALLLDLTAPEPGAPTLHRLHSAVVGGLTQCSWLRDRLFPEEAGYEEEEEPEGE